MLPAWDVPGAEEPPYPAVAREMQRALHGDSSGHDLAHAWRVFDLGRSIAAEEGADRHVVGLGALVHDYHRVVGDGEYVHPEATLDDVAEILRAGGVADTGTVDAVQHCVAVHDDFAYQGDPDRVETVEAAVLQDADNLDAIGAVGIGRAFAFGGDRGFPLWVPPGDAAPDGGPAEDGAAADGGTAPESEPSTLGHFDEKLFRIENELNTETAAEIAAERTAFLEEFADRFRREWRGDA